MAGLPRQGWKTAYFAPALEACAACLPAACAGEAYTARRTGRGARGDRTGDLRQVVGDDPPADPAPEPRLAVVAAPLQPVVPFQDVGPPFRARPEAEPAAELALAFTLLALLGQPPGLRQDNVFAAAVAGGASLSGE